MSPVETFLGFDFFEKRKHGCHSQFSRIVGYRAERRTKRTEMVEARTIVELRTLVRAIVSARRTGVIR